MEDNPHTTTVIALAIGVLIGYAAHRPPPRRNWWSNVADAVDTATRATANSFETAARELIENQPYTAIGIALAVGWLLGRMHRPL
jgi:ElaB/YqjD/DUF883 family membrane-anchored ribosome-binding protein